MSLLDRIRKEAAENTGFRAHPLGEFPAIVEEVKLREHDGQEIYDIHMRTERGKPKVGIFKNTYADVDGRLLQICNGDRSQAEDRYVKAMTRLVRLYLDFGLPAPGGDDYESFEREAYGRLGEIIGRSCTVVVQQDRKYPKDPSKQAIFINAPRGERVAPPSGPVISSAFDELNPPPIDNPPF